MRSEHLYDALHANVEGAYQAFLSGLIPNIPPERILGVRTPVLRRMARQLEDGEAFLAQLPHTYFEENQIHSFLLEQGRDFVQTLAQVEAFLPFVDNWATCDQLRPKVFAAQRSRLLEPIGRWLSSDLPYTQRFAMEMLMCHFLDGDFVPEDLQWVAQVESGEYYVQMMQAWYFATALAKQYQETLPILTQQQLPAWVHNKAIQKAVESRRLTMGQKAFLKTLRIK